MCKRCTTARALPNTEQASLSHLLRLLARLTARLAPLLMLLLLTLRLRFLRLTGEGLADSELLKTLSLGFSSSSSELLRSDTAGLALGLAGSFLGLASLSESLAAGLGLLSGLLLSARAGDLALTTGSFFSFGPASSESESESGLSALVFAVGSAFLVDLGLSVFVALLSFLALPLSSAAAFLPEERSLLRSDRLSLLRLRGEGGEGLRRRLGELRLGSLLRESRCLNDMGLAARL